MSQRDQLRALKARMSMFGVSPDQENLVRLIDILLGDEPMGVIPAHQAEQVAAKLAERGLTLEQIGWVAASDE